MKAQLKSFGQWLLRPLLCYRGAPSKLYLTFDDGPHPEVTPRVLAALDQYHVKATFFMIGQEMERHPNIVKDVRDQGHAIALHGFAHQHCTQMSWREQLHDLHRMRSVAKQFGVTLQHYRPAYGELSVLRLAWCLWHRVKIVMWSFESRDSFVTQVAELEARVSPSALADGDILLFHDDTLLTALALPTILGRAHATGLRFGLLDHT